VNAYQTDDPQVGPSVNAPHSPETDTLAAFGSPASTVASRFVLEICWSRASGVAELQRRQPDA